MADDRMERLMYRVFNVAMENAKFHYDLSLKLVNQNIKQHDDPDRWNIAMQANARAALIIDIIQEVDLEEEFFNACEEYDENWETYIRGYF